MRFIQFLTEAGKWGVTLMTGGILSFTVGFIEHFRGSSFRAISYTVVGFAAFMVGAFLAWRNARVKLEEEQAKQGRPDITGEFRNFEGDAWLLVLRNSSPFPAVDIHIEDIRYEERVLRFIPPSTLVKDNAISLISCGILCNGWTQTDNVMSLFEGKQFIGSTSPTFRLNVRFSSLDYANRRHWLFSGIFWYDAIQQNIVLSQQSIASVL